MSTSPQNNLPDASIQWANRPDDQRFLTLAELKASVALRKSESWTAQTKPGKLQVFPVDAGKARSFFFVGRDVNARARVGIGVRLFDVSQGRERIVEPTNWAFGQLAQNAQAPAAYLRKLPAELAAINLQWGIEKMPLRDDCLILAQTNGSETLRALTSIGYGRIWDSQVVEAVERVNKDGRWQVPAASYSTTNPKRATTLYASDRDVFIFLVDPENPVEVGGETLFRGFMVWNSEVGSAVFGLTTFLYRYVCDNRIIWGATEVKELRIRHTGGAPERFGQEGRTYLNRYAQESTAQLVETIKRAQAFELPKSESKDGKGGWENWLKSRGFTAPQAKDAVSYARSEEGQDRSLWNIINGVTASARALSHTDSRVELERKAGDLMKLVA